MLIDEADRYGRPQPVGKISQNVNKHTPIKTRTHLFVAVLALFAASPAQASAATSSDHSSKTSDPGRSTLTTRIAESSAGVIGGIALLFLLSRRKH